MQNFPIIVYVPGELADVIGAKNLQEITDTISKMNVQPVEIQTYGECEHHSRIRYIGKKY